ncbi:hypothetical protein G7050_02495 [Dysgonomonas sp. HDW5A]|uniref:S24 family peptidase n=1 Tax=Dysgonomonas sp. HDW5A TaxID=2714926 RepID=UPI00140B1EEB|nr:S24 family peptidase [Dysgonomonas sp. HDW5A]QIK58768.1 hypothetical protein G7050_02495 [Dysgonomonas sp. HDW5A]
MTTKDRLYSFIKHEGITAKAFESIVGLGNGFVSKVGFSIRKEKLELISIRYPHLNINWLITGVGEMLNSNRSYKNNDQNVVDTANEDNAQYGVKEIYGPSDKEYEIPNDGTYRLVPLINSDAVGGMHKVNDISYTDEEYIKAYIPFTDALHGDVCIQVTSDSMNPTCPAGCVVQIREVVNWKEYFGYGNIFVVQLKDGRRVIKEVTRYDSNPNDYVLCVSHNKNVPAEELPKSFIVSVWKVIKILNNRGW